MDNLLDDAFNEQPQNNNSIIFATFWARVWASLIDLLVIMPLTLPIMFYNLSTWKNVFVLTVITIIPLIYKIFMEYTYGATLGKMARRIVVVNYDLGKPSFEAVCMRNIIGVASGVATFLSILYVFSLPGFKDITGFIAYTDFIDKQSQASTVNNIVSLVYMLDVFMMLGDKQNRTYHDKIGKTYVVKRSSLSE